MDFKIDTAAGRCKWLCLIVVGLWVPSAAAAMHFYGSAGVQATLVSAICCLAAGCLTFRVVEGAPGTRVQAFAVLIGTLIRGGFALAAVAIMQLLLNLTYDNYLIWLALFYLISLTVETLLLVRFKAPAGDGGDGRKSLP
ncbi:MAG: hypothetical protein HY290_10550 [Planctomycetia bacterium]|nr:hypothetical protein [Planctomycetia bacterium]